MIHLPPLNGLLAPKTDLYQESEYFYPFYAKPHTNIFKGGCVVNANSSARGRG